MRLYDYQSVLDRVTEKIKSKNQWKDFYNSSTGTVLREMIATGIEMLGFHLEKSVAERFIGTAITTSAIKQGANDLGYNYRRKTAGVGRAVINFTTALVSEVTISKGQMFLVGDYSYTVIEDKTIAAGETSAELVIYQGEYKRIEYPLASLGTISKYVSHYDNDKIESLVLIDDDESVMPYDDVSSNFFQVAVDRDIAADTVTYSQLTSTLGSLVGADRRYIIDYYFGDMRLFFSDGELAINPSDEDANPTIIIEYLKTDGDLGNIYSEQTGLNFYTPNSYPTNSITLSNVTGGSVAEDKESIRVNAPRLFASGNRAVRKADYKGLLEKLSNVAVAIAWGEQEEIENNSPSAVIKSCRNKARYILIGEDYADISTTSTHTITTTGAYNYSFSLSEYPILGTAVSIAYTIGGTDYTGTDDGEGIISGTELSGTITYSNGNGTLGFITPPTGNIVISYKNSTATDTIKTYIDGYKTITVQTEYVDPWVNNYINTMDLAISLAIDPGYVLSDVSASVNTEITDTFNLAYFSEGGKFYKSELIDVIMGVKGVRGCVVTWTLDDVLFTEDVWDTEVEYDTDRPFAHVLKIGNITIS